MKRVLVTGANGWIGRHVMKRLIEKEYEVHAVSRRKIQCSSIFCKWYQADLLKIEDIRNLIQTVKPTHLLHLAWEAAPGEYWYSLKNYLWVQASIELIYSFGKFGGKRAVMAGTCAEYDWKYGYLTETISPLSDETPYAASKNSVQSILHSFSETTGLSSAWGRIFFLYGPGEHPFRLVPSVIISLLKNKEALCTHGEQFRDFLYIDDAAEAFVALLESNVQGPVNIASGRSIQVKELIYKMSDMLGKTEFVKLGAVPFSKKEPLFIGANTELIRENAKWKPAFDIETGINQSISWWKQNLIE